MTLAEQLDVDEALKIYDVVLVDKADSWLMRSVAAVLWPLLGEAFMRDYWTTLRFPFCDPRIYCPSRGQASQAHEHTQVLRHELVHVRQFAPWWGPLWMALLYLLAPLPVIFSGRWFIERPAYLLDIRYFVARGSTRAKAIDWAVEQLWRAYGWPWPRPLMTAWFEAQLEVEAPITDVPLAPKDFLRGPR